MRTASFWILVAGIVLLLDPHCKGGCRSLAEHLLAHGLQRL